MSFLTRCLAPVLAAIGLASGLQAAPPSNSLEAAVKASYLTKFGPFIDWPDGALPPGAPARICVVGDDPFGKTIDEAARGQQMDGHLLVVARMSTIDASAAVSCQIMFVGKPTTQATAATLHAARGLPVLTVTDRSRGVRGGIIEFVVENGRVRFDIDQGAAQACGLQISAKLLALAVEVRR